MSTLPWDASSIGLVQEQVIEHIWKVEFPGIEGEKSEVPAWNIEVSLDGSRSPYGEATFKAPTSYMQETANGSGTFFTKLTPYNLPAVRIWAGWRYVKNGAIFEDLQILFSGFVVTRELTLEDGNAILQFTAQTAEAVYDQPNSRSGSSSVGNTWTSLNQACTTIAGYATPWYKTPTIVEESGFMNTPSPAQLTSWRSGSFEGDDQVMDLLRSWAAELGQWVRGNVRSNLTTPSLLVSADPYPYRSYFTFPATVFTKINRKDSLDDWANVLKLTATWNATDGTPATKKKVYVGAGVVAGATLGPVRSKDVTLQLKPPGGTLSATYPIAQAWLRRIKDMSEVFYIATGRAIWWLQPRIHGLQVSGLGLMDAPGPISSVVFGVDTGVMTVSWNTNNTRT